MRTERTWRVVGMTPAALLAGAGLAGAGLVLSACASGGGQAQQRAEVSVSGLDDDPAPSTDPMAKAAKDLEELMAKRAQGRSSSAGGDEARVEATEGGGATAQTAAGGRAAGKPTAATAATTNATAATTNAPGATVNASTPTAAASATAEAAGGSAGGQGGGQGGGSAAHRVTLRPAGGNAGGNAGAGEDATRQSPEALAERLLAASEKSRGGQSGPVAKAIAAAALRGVTEPPAATWLAARQGLSERQAAVVEALGDSLRQLRTMSEGSTEPDAAAMATVIADLHARTSASGRLSVPRAALCDSVAGYGRYTEAPAMTFLAGRAHPLVAYVEVEGFSNAPATATSSEGGTLNPEERYAVELSLDVDIFTADGVKAWDPSPVTIRETSRNIRRDLFLVRRIEIPRHLSMGAYNVKVQVRDLPSGGLAEHTIAIQLTGDPRVSQKAAETGARQGRATVTPE
ncbi:MAG: hypothetical protein ACK51N_03280 [bacterium]|nr:hypothetical protein [Planctomycetaceae bacterium]